MERGCEKVRVPGTAVSREEVGQGVRKRSSGSETGRREQKQMMLEVAGQENVHLARRDTFL